MLLCFVMMGENCISLRNTYPSEITCVSALQKKVNELKF